MNGISLGRNVPSELLDQLFQCRHQTLFFTFSMANSPNSRWAS
ncbi:hypothetical protein EJ065_3187 [Corallococcus coralloides]|uniref:Uncharacterized protein n=1 Tax=Corallococcus coralloides TaxID=184914 RepID=A0A410RS77_CORCK|nr:hypothetical protein EJ065_3187 [Corallococcus coralloides]